jgi:hypothetical protein
MAFFSKTSGFSPTRAIQSAAINSSNAAIAAIRDLWRSLAFSANNSPSLVWKNEES